MHLVVINILCLCPLFDMQVSLPIILLFKICSSDRRAALLSHVATRPPQQPPRAPPSTAATSPSVFLGASILAPRPPDPHSLRPGVVLRLASSLHRVTPAWILSATTSGLLWTTLVWGGFRAAVRQILIWRTIMRKSTHRVERRCLGRGRQHRRCTGFQAGRTGYIRWDFLWLQVAN